MTPYLFLFRRGEVLLEAALQGLQVPLGDINKAIIDDDEGISDGDDETENSEPGSDVGDSDGALESVETRTRSARDKDFLYRTLVERSDECHGCENKRQLQIIVL